MSSFSYKSNSFVARHPTLFVALVSGVMLVTGGIFFFVTVQGEEETIVPQVVAHDLLSALTTLQERSLVPRVEARHSTESAKWQVIEQNPDAGALVKAGRPVHLVISRGPIIDRLYDYVGRDLEEVRMELQALFASHPEIIRIKEPITSVTDVAPPGMILSQNPFPGIPIDELVVLELVVSKGPQRNLIKLEDYVSQPFGEVRNRLSALNMPFVFRARPARSSEEPGAIISQSPNAGQEIPYSSVLQLVMTIPTEIEEGMAFGLIESTLPDYPILVDLKLEVILAGEKRTVLEMKHPGGPIAIPYLVDENSQLVLTMFEDEILTQPAR